MELFTGNTNRETDKEIVNVDGRRGLGREKGNIRKRRRRDLTTRKERRK